MIEISTLKYWNHEPEVPAKFNSTCDIFTTDDRSRGMNIKK
jgi:hypothetical protein